MAGRECGECFYYDTCTNEDCPPDKEPHGFCYVNPPERVQGVFGQGDAAIDFDIEINNYSEVPAGRPGCRFWEQ